MEITGNSDYACRILLFLCFLYVYILTPFDFLGKFIETYKPGCSSWAQNKGLRTL